MTWNYVVQSSIWFLIGTTLGYLLRDIRDTIARKRRVKVPANNKVNLVGWVLIIVVGFSALLSGINARNQATQSAHVERIAICQANINQEILEALSNRDELSAASSDNLDKLIKDLTTPGPDGETQTARVNRAGKNLARYYTEARRISDTRVSIKLPSVNDAKKCK